MNISLSSQPKEAWADDVDVISSSVSLLQHNVDVLQNVASTLAHQLIIVEKAHGAARFPEDLLARMVRRLVINAAIYATPNTDIRLTCDVTHEHLVISIHNQGGHIRSSSLSMHEPSDAHQVYDAVQACQMPLYLSVMKALIQAFGGQLIICTAIDYSTTIRILLPLIPSERANMRRARATRREAKKASKISPPVTGHTNVLACVNDKTILTDVMDTGGKQFRFSLVDDHLLLAFGANKYAYDAILIEANGMEERLYKALEALYKSTIWQQRRTPVVVITSFVSHLNRLNSLPYCTAFYRSEDKLMVGLNDLLMSMIEKVRHEQNQIDEQIANYHLHSYQILADNSRDEDFLLRFHSYIEQHYADESINRDSVAEALALSPRTFNRRLAAASNKNFLQYLTTYRLEKAVELIAQGHTVTQACYSVGFASASNFSAAFKKHFGVVPSHFTAKRNQPVKVLLFSHDH